MTLEQNMAINEVHVSRNLDLPDPLGEEVSNEAKRVLGIQTTVRTTTNYRLEGASVEDAQILATAVLIDPITETGKIGSESHTAVAFVGDTFVFIDKEGKKSVEVSYRPEMTDPVAGTVEASAEDLGIPLEAARVSKTYTFDSKTTPKEAAQITTRLLVNDKVETVVNIPPETLITKGEIPPVETIYLQDASDERLMEISDKRRLSLNLAEMKIIRQEAKRRERDFTDVELEILAARWSEHCVHKTFNAKVITPEGEKPSLFSRIKNMSRRHFKNLVATAFDDNSGGIHFYDDTVVLIKWETHNSPSAIDPVGGAATGSGGVFRDIMGTGQGAKVILSTDAFAVAPPEMKQEELPPKTIPPDNLLRGLVKGVSGYGNPMGIPTPNGSVHFHPDFAAKPTVLVGAYGITPEQYAYKKDPDVGDRVVVIGGRTGRDGIHGATISSGERTEKTATIDAAHVQMGNPIEERKMADAILEARDKGLIRALTDCGAAGFSSAIGELAENVGVTVDISKAPLKYEGLSPWEIWLSESQERMALAIDPQNLEEFLEVCRRYEVEATDLGVFDGSNSLTVKYGDETVAELDYEFLKHGLPQREMEAEYARELSPEPEVELPKDWVGTLKNVLSHGNVCSKQPIVRQYDTSVQGTNALPPFGGVNLDAPNDATIITPILNKPYGLIVSHGLNPILNRIDPERGAKWAVVEAVSNAVAVGANIEEMAICGNYIWPTPDRHFMGALDVAVDSVNATQDALGLPTISGKDSLSATYAWPDKKTKTHAPPVVNISTIARIPDVSKTVSTDIKRPGSTLVAIGKRHEGMGGSVYYDTLGHLGNEVPDIDVMAARATAKSLHIAIQEGGISACHDVSEGGLISTIAEMAFGGGCGVVLDININERPDFFLFNETAGTFIVEVDDPEQIKDFFGEVPHMVIGRTTEEKQVKVNYNESELFTAELLELKEAWQRPMQELFHVAAAA